MDKPVPSLRLTVVGLGVGVLTFCMACQAPSGSQIDGPGDGPSDGQITVRSLPRPTAKIEALRQPQQVERSVSLTGAVAQRLAILNGWLYQLDDGTGQVWVLTQQVAPAVGNQVYVSGVLRYEAIPINGADLGDYYLEEKQRQLQSPEESPEESTEAP